MDCEKFETTMMDELYGELDDVTSAALKRHVAGCTRCGSLFGGLRATRRVAAVPLVEPPAALEARILEKAGPTIAISARRQRMAYVLSIAGSWAMRPQTAMAALFLVMVATSVLLLHGKSSRDAAGTAVTVVEEGTPAPATASATPLGGGPPPPMSGATPTAKSEGLRLSSPDKTTSAQAVKDAGRAAFSDDTPLRESARPILGQPHELPGAFMDIENRDSHGDSVPQEPAGAASPAAAAGSQGGARGWAPPTPGPSFATALGAYQAHQFDEARRDFEVLAPTDVSADLWAARSLREARGCGAAAPRFDQVADRTAGPPGWQALLEAADCYHRVGDDASARARLTRLLSVDSFRDRARAELQRITRAPGSQP
ncbi:MAG: zf-HC2 domain-containing protein [Polyangiaceae bacterium]|jgi:hypothetical protein